MMETGKKTASMEKDNLLKQMDAASTTVTGKMIISTERAPSYKREPILLTVFGTTAV